MRVFVPVEDQSLDGESGILVPYRQGLACVHGLRGDAAQEFRDSGEGFVLDEDGWLCFGVVSDGSSARRPDARRSGPPGRR